MKQNHSEDGDEQKNVPRQRPRRGKGQNDVVGRLRGSTLKNLFENRTAERKDESTTVDELVSLGIDPHVFFELPCSVRKQVSIVVYSRWFSPFSPFLSFWFSVNLSLSQWYLTPLGMLKFFFILYFVLNFTFFECPRFWKRLPDRNLRW